MTLLLSESKLPIFNGLRSQEVNQEARKIFVSAEQFSLD